MPNAPFFVSGGTLPLSANSYVERAADRELLDALSHGRYAYVLNARQMGKSSLCVRTVARLKEAGVRTAFVDLTRIGGGNVTPDQWYVGLLGEIGRATGGRSETVRYWNEYPDVSPMQRFFGALAAHALPEGAPPLVVFVDEVDATRSLPFSADEFFGGIRECFNRRAHDRTFERLTFCLLGAAIPSELIHDMEASPFNIGERIAVKDFTKEEASAFAAGLGAAGLALIRRVHYWTGGHPFLTQSLCGHLAETGAKTPADVDRLVESHLFAPSARESNVNLADVGNRVLLSSEGGNSDRHRAEILTLYDRVRRGKRVEDDESNPRVAILKLAGLVVAERGSLRVRNRVYARVFGPTWIAEHMPNGEVRRVRRAYRVGLLRATAVGGTLVLAMTGLAGYALAQAGEARKATHLARSKTWEATQANAELRESAHRLRKALDQAKAALALAETRRGQAQRAQGIAVQARNDARASAHAAKLSAEKAGEETTRAVRAKKAADLASEREAAQRRLAVAARGDADARLRAALAGDARNLMQTGDDAGALRPLVAGLRLMANDPLAADAQRRRIGFALASSSGLRQVWPARGGATASALSPDGRVAAVGDASGAVLLWSVETGAALSAPLRNPGRVRALAYSRDGRLATAGGAGVRVWSADGHPLTQPIARPMRINAVRFSPDGRVLAVAEGDGSQDKIGGVALLDATTGALRQRVPFVVGAAPDRLDYSTDGRRLAVGSGNVMTHVLTLSPESGLPTSSHSAGRSYSAAAVRFSPDGRWLAVAGTFDANGTTGNAALCEASTGRDVVEYRDARTAAQTSTFQSRGTAVEFTPNGDAVLVANDSGVARLWGTLDSVPQGPPLRHDAPVVAAVLSPDGSRAATACVDGSIHVWDPRTGEAIGSPFWHGGAVTSLAYDPSGTRLLSSSDDGTARVWEVGGTDHAARRIASPGGKTSVAGFIDISRVDAPVVLMAGDGGYRLGTMNRDLSRVSVLGGGGWSWTYLDYQIASGRIVLRRSDRIQVWDLTTGLPLTPEIKATPVEGKIHADLDKDGHFLLAEESPGFLTVRRVDRAGTLVGRTPVGHRASFAAFAGGETIAIAREDGTGTLWRPTDGRVLRQWPAGFREFCPDAEARRFVRIREESGGKRLALQIVDARTGHDVAHASLPTESTNDAWLRASDHVVFVFYGSGERRLARVSLEDGSLVADEPLNTDNRFAANENTLVALDASFDLHTGRRLARFPGKIFNRGVVAFAPTTNGRTFAAADARNDLRVWNATTGRPETPPMHLASLVRDLAFSPDRRLLASACDNGDVRVWDACTGAPITPVLRHPTKVNRVRFAEGGQALLIVADGLTVVPLAADPRPIAELARLADLVSSGGEQARVDAAGWNVLRQRYPAEFTYRTAHPEPVSPLIRDEKTALDAAMREASLSLDGADAWFEYALASARVGRWDEGLEAVKRSERAGRTGVASDYLKGVFQARTGRYRDALATFQAARRSYPGDLFTSLIAGTSLRAGDYGAFASNREAQLNAIRDLPPEVLAQQRYFVALAYGLADQPSQSRRLLAPLAAQVVPGTSLEAANDVVWSVSVMPGTLADYAPVVRVFEPLVRAEPSWERLNTLGLLLYRAGRDADAAQAIEQGVRLHHGQADPSDELVLGAALGRRDEAIAHLRRAVAGFDAALNALLPGAQERLELETLLREAQGLLKARQAPDRRALRSGAH